MTPGERSEAAFRASEAWRRHPMLKVGLRNVFPGFGLGLAAFVVYVAGETAVTAARGRKGAGAGGGHGEHH